MSSNRSPLVQLTLSSFARDKNVKKFSFKKDGECSDSDDNKMASSSSYKKTIRSSDSDSEISDSEQKKSKKTLRDLYQLFPNVTESKIQNLFEKSGFEKAKSILKSLEKKPDEVELLSSDEEKIKKKRKKNDKGELLKEPKAKKSRVIIDSDSDIDENSNLSSTNSKREKINKVVSSEEEEKNSSKEEKAKKKSKSSNKKAKKEKKEKKDRKEDQERDNIHDDDYYNKSDCGSSNSGSDDDDTNLTEKELALRESVLVFFNTASSNEMRALISINKKHAESLISRRPYKDYIQLKKKNSSETALIKKINSIKEVMHAREIVNELMNKCEKISQNLQKDTKNLMDKKDISIDMKTTALKIKVQPKLLNPDLQLKPYQLIGLNWLCIMHQSKINGILADEMGLGKTIQAIAFIAYLLETGSTGIHLIVVPPSTLDNWLNEIESWCSSINYIVYSGSQDERRIIRYELRENKYEKPINVLITTYSLISSSVEDKSFFGKFKFDYCIFDEAHMLKNMTTIRYQSLIKINSKRKILLTGTPLQNNLIELISLLNFVMPEIFHHRTEHIKKLFTSGETGKENSGNYYNDKINQAKGIMKPFILRRLKTEVLKHLPKKNINLKYCQMSERQNREYLSLISNYVNRSEEVLESVEKYDDKNNKQAAQNSISSASNIIMELRKCANHPLLRRCLYDDTKLKKMARLITKDSSPDTVFEYVVEDMTVMSDFELHKLCSVYRSVKEFALTNQQILDSGKFQIMDELLPEKKARGEKVLIFSQFVIMLDIVEEYLKIKNHKYCRLDGLTAVSERQDMIDEFNTSEELFIFIISTKAGGMGINLTSANVVILHDIDYNPYNDKQAEDRCHRVGQTKDVEIYKLISKDSIDESMLKIQMRKIELGEDLANEGNESQTKSDMVSLLKEALKLN